MEQPEQFTRTGKPAAEVEIDAALIARLLEEQHPDLAALPLEHVDAGWDNAIYRLGTELAVRLPRRQLGAQLVEHEQRWLPELASRLTLPVPVPMRVGEPGAGYPWRWSIVPWLTGVPADMCEPDASQAVVLAQFLRSLHVPAPDEAPPNPFRDVPLVKLTKVDGRLDRIAQRTELVSPSLRQTWRSAVAAPIDQPLTWIHADLHPRNVLVERGILTGILDWGDMTAGDRATDLASLWILFDDDEFRRDALRVYGEVTPATLLRAQGWAIFCGSMFLDSGLHDGDAMLTRIGERILRRVEKAD